MKTIKMILLIFGIALLAVSCGKDDPTQQTNVAPVLSTPELIEISNISATVGSKISAGDNITVRGVCWSTAPDPTTDDNKTTDGSGAGNFTSAITGLSVTTKYYVRSYATNSDGTVYGSQESFTTLANGALGSDYLSIADIEGNVYSIVTIGTQTWMAENLRTAKYNDDTAIPHVTSNSSWTARTTGAYCLYENTTETGWNIQYGKLYNGYAVNTGKLCPAGWHIPTKSDWEKLVNYLGGETVAGGKMKATFTGLFFWKAPNAGATDESKFRGLPGGARYVIPYFEHGSFQSVRDWGNWWSSTKINETENTIIRLSFESSRVMFVSGGNFHEDIKNGYSCRCVKD